ncbi:MAG TPA: glycosyltransferase [Mycobacteriales bacterium]|nr:glycosyltransferase [Mycobacteriales bacterium]
MNLLVVASAGGHLREAQLLRERLEGVDAVTWVTFPGEQADALARSEHVIEVPPVHPRDAVAAAAALPRARRVIQAERPDLVLSTGAAVALPFLAVAGLRRIRAHYVESVARSTSPSLTGRLLRPLPGVRVHAQHRGLGVAWPFVGCVFDAYEPVPRPVPPPDRPLRVLALLGTMPFAFDRLVRELTLALPAEAEVCWQLGSTVLPAGAPRVQAAPRFALPQMRERLCWADTVVTHAGVGSIMDAWDAGHRPVVLPRRHADGEHVDDHQVAMAAQLIERGLVAGWPSPEAPDLRDASRTGVRRRYDAPSITLSDH